MDNRESNQAYSVPRLLPWTISIVFLLVYLVTLNRWVTHNSLLVVSAITGWDWAPMINGPVYYIVTLPLSFLPISLEPLGLNLLSAVLAAAVLWQLVRSVTLLPHDRSKDQRQRERSEFSLLSIRNAWLPPLFAALICGFQLTFWEHATAASQEMLNLLFFAYVVRCLLEYRIDQRDSWFYRMALVYGISMTNNWAMIGFLPLFFGAILWIKGLDVLRFSFLLKCVLLGMVGLVLYFLLPAVVATDPISGTFWEALKVQLWNQKVFLWDYPRGPALLLSLTSILPVLVIGIRWPSSFGDTSVVGTKITGLMFRVMHLVLLAACVWVAFDAGFSPRGIGSGLHFLPYYYLGALAIGYFVGYFLLIGSKEPSRSHRRGSGKVKPAARLYVAGVWIAFVAVPAGLIMQNQPELRVTNGPALSQYAALSLKNLPAEKALVLSDQPFLTLLMKAELAQQKSERDYLFIDTGYTSHIPYYQQLRNDLLEQNPNEFTTENLPDKPDNLTIVRALQTLAQNTPIYYLHPSFGQYFEVFYVRPRGLVHELVLYEDNVAFPPAFSDELIRENESNWNEAKQTFENISANIENEFSTSILIGGWLSHCLNHWAVELQVNDRLREASAHFAKSLDWNPRNLSAELNIRFNENLTTGNTSSIVLTEEQQERMKNDYRDSLDLLLRSGGPFDDPDRRLTIGQQFNVNGNFRQAAIQMNRISILEPENLDAKLRLANATLLAGFSEAVLESIAQIKANATDLQEATTEELLRLEAATFFRLGNREHALGNEALAKENFNRAETILQKTLENYPDSETIIKTLSQIYLLTDRSQEAIPLLDRLLELNPRDVNVMQNKSLAQIQSGQFDEAIETSNAILSVAPDYTAARMNRAIAYLQSTNNPAAKADYELLLEIMENSHAIRYGLGEIAYREGDSAEAIFQYENYVELAPEGTEEHQLITERLQELKNTAP